MKKSLLRVAAALVAAASLFCLPSCEFFDGLGELVSQAVDSVMNGSGTSSPGEESGTGTDNDTGDPSGFPLQSRPVLEEITLPDVESDDPLEAEASSIADGAIARALACVNAMRDERHSGVSYAFDADANGYLSALNASEQKLFSRFVEAFGSGSVLTVDASEYDGDLKAAYFALHTPLSFCEPLYGSFCAVDGVFLLPFGADTTVCSKLYNYYFDPDADENRRTDNSDVTLSHILERVRLMELIVDRVIRFMPEGLTAYDKYYYLAAFLSERVFYDDRPANCFTAYGALVGGRAVCEGYSTAYVLLCRRAGLWCAYRTGKPDGGNHIWNMIRLESGIYNVDVTWCDGEGSPESRRWYDYFVKSDAEFESHSPTSGVASTGDREPCPYEN